VGRPYGCTAILHRQTFINSIKAIYSKDSRTTGIIIQSRYGICMPTNSGDDECLEKYVDACSRIIAIYIDSHAVNCIIFGDFNCQQAPRLHTLFTQLGSDINLILSDINRLSDDTFTYCVVIVGLTCHRPIIYCVVLYTVSLLTIKFTDNRTVC